MELGWFRLDSKCPHPPGSSLDGPSHVLDHVHVHTRCEDHMLSTSPPPTSFSSLVLCRNSTEPPFVNILIKSLWLLAAFSPCQMNHRLCVCLVKEIFWFKCFQILARNRRQIHIACFKRFLNDRKIIKFFNFRIFQDTIYMIFKIRSIKLNYFHITI